MTKKIKAFKKAKRFGKKLGPVKLVHSRKQKIIHVYKKDDPSVNKTFSYN